MATLPDTAGAFVGRVWDPAVEGPCVVKVSAGRLVDITTRAAPTIRDICEMDDPAAFVAAAQGRDLGAVEDLADARLDPDKLHLLAPCDLQAVKACGVTFVGSMIERVIEERAAGDLKAADAIRGRISAAIGESLRNIVPGSADAMTAKEALIA